MRAFVTGAGGLVGSAAARLLAEQGYEVWGIDNNMRAELFGPAGSVADELTELKAELDGTFLHYRSDIRDGERMTALMARAEPELVIHAAAQPSHDWAARAPLTDFTINSLGTVNIANAVLQKAPDATLCHISTNKVYGARPNQLPLLELETRLDLAADHRYANGIDTTMPIDQTTHSLFGASKASADLMVQEYGRYYGLNAITLRPGCITGAAHRGVEQHGFLAYLMRCAKDRKPYTVIGYDGLQVRDNLDAADLAAACLAIHRGKRRPGAVYNIGGGRRSSCSIAEALGLVDRILGRRIEIDSEPEPRIGDHRWWITDNGPLLEDYPTWPAPRKTALELLEAIDRGGRVKI